MRFQDHLKPFWDYRGDRFSYVHHIVYGNIDTIRWTRKKARDQRQVDKRPETIRQEKQQKVENRQEKQEITNKRGKRFQTRESKYKNKRCKR